MARGNDKTIPCDDRARAGRHAKMEQFWTAAGIINTLTDDDQDLVDAFAERGNRMHLKAGQVHSIGYR